MTIQNRCELTFALWRAHPEHGKASHHDFMVSAAEEATVH